MYFLFDDRKSHEGRGKKKNEQGALNTAHVACSYVEAPDSGGRKVNFFLHSITTSSEAESNET